VISQQSLVQGSCSHTILCQFATLAQKGADRPVLHCKEKYTDKPSTANRAYKQSLQKLKQAKTLCLNKHFWKKTQKRLLFLV